MKKLYGIVTAMVTPFNKDETIRVEAIRQHVDFLIEKGVNCLYPLGTTTYWLLRLLPPHSMVRATMREPSLALNVIPVQALSSLGKKVIRVNTTHRVIDNFCFIRALFLF